MTTTSFSASIYLSFLSLSITYTHFSFGTFLQLCSLVVILRFSLILQFAFNICICTITSTIDSTTMRTFYRRLYMCDVIKYTKTLVEMHPQTVSKAETLCHLIKHKTQFAVVKMKLSPTGECCANKKQHSQRIF